jgi:hypothetical protein
VAEVYLIRGWNEHFECSQSRKRKQAMNWVATPTKHDGKSFRRLMLMDDGLEIYGAWMLMVQIAAKCPTRGVLADADGPLDTSDLAVKTGCPQSKFDKALKVLSEKKIGWIVVEEWEGIGSTLPPQDSTRQYQPTNQPDTPPNGEVKTGWRAGGVVFESTWEAVAQRLAALEVVQWPQAVDAAKAAGCFPKLAHDLIDHAERYGFGPGAIAKRFAIASPTLGINTGWPNTDRPETAELKRVQESVGKRAKRASEEAERRAWELCKAGIRAGKTKAELQSECIAA